MFLWAGALPAMRLLLRAAGEAALRAESPRRRQRINEPRKRRPTATEEVPVAVSCVTRTAFSANLRDVKSGNTSSSNSDSG
eukprot:CAMPEP_0177755978 /NCGR_PEP_ID=MMETSP0491_2-20121128/2862_1 /TAXON_ID=63592 /ORGANISM="Tetraselmis chuii, Strain PLY429" /LENGTH=80 /DNA_ID=CAMNT_0019271527 /DNA_START=1024 /DNA_END=1266 /DNA_ORIENTATION=-